MITPTQGKGEVHFANGDRYHGSLVDTRLDGEGKMFFCDGASYEGKFQLDLRHGKFLILLSSVI